MVIYAIAKGGTNILTAKDFSLTINIVAASYDSFHFLADLTIV